MKTNKIIICLSIVFLLLSACNKPNTPEAGETVQGQATADTSEWMTDLGTMDDGATFFLK